jgi:hypothetical protein
VEFLPDSGHAVETISTSRCLWSARSTDRARAMVVCNGMQRAIPHYKPDLRSTSSTLARELGSLLVTKAIVVSLEVWGPYYLARTAGYL